MESHQHVDDTKRKLIEARNPSEETRSEVCNEEGSKGCISILQCKQPINKTEEMARGNGHTTRGDVLLHQTRDRGGLGDGERGMLMAALEREGAA
jgi:hypothetical protein